MLGLIINNSSIAKELFGVDNNRGAAIYVYVVEALEELVLLIK